MFKKILALVVASAMATNPFSVVADTAIRMTEKDIQGAVVSDIKDGMQYPELKVLCYQDGRAAVYPVERIAHGNGTNEYYIIEDGLFPGSGREGYFTAAVYEGGEIAADIYIIHAGGEGAIVSPNLAFIDEKYGRRYPLYMMRNGFLAYRDGRYTKSIIDTTTFTEVLLAFNYGETIFDNTSDNPNGYIIPQFVPLEIEYSPAREQYIVLYYQSPYFGVDNDDSFYEHLTGYKVDGTYDYRQSWVGVALFDKTGKQVADHRMHGRYYAELGYDPGDEPASFTLSDTPILVGDSTEEIYVWGLIKQEYIKSNYKSYFNDKTDWVEGEEKYPPWKQNTPFLRGTCYTKINLDTGVYEVISREEYVEQIPNLEFPFCFELRRDGTYVLDREKTATAPLAFIEGDYIPVDYSINTDNSWQVILASYEAIWYKDQYPEHPHNKV